MPCWRLPWTKNVEAEQMLSEKLSRMSKELLKLRNSSLRCARSCPSLKRRRVVHGRNWDDVSRRNVTERCRYSQDSLLLLEACKWFQ
jgi:hypothetical protein